MLAVVASSRYLDAQKRLTAGANDALETISLETNQLAQDIRMAGQGLVFGDSFFCKTFTGEPGFLQPITVKSDTATSDLLRLVYVDSPFGTASTTLKQQITSTFNPNQLNYDPGNVTMILTKDDAENCSVITGSSAPLAVPVPVGAKAIPVSTFRDVSYSIDKDRLMERDNRLGTINEIASNIVFMKVYALINNAWVPAADHYLYASNLTVSAQFGKTAPGALKLFIIGREPNFATTKSKTGTCLANTQYTLEKSLPWKPSVDGPAVTLSGDWQCYNYQAMELVVPLLNISLGTQKL